MKVKKSKQVELWPEYDSPDRIEYSDLTPLKRAVYEEARRCFTSDNIEAAQAGLGAVKDFNLIERLQRAVFMYYWCKSGRKQDLDILGLLPPSQQVDELKDLTKKVSALLKICENKPGYILELLAEYIDRDGLDAAQYYLKGLTGTLKRLLEKAKKRQAEIKVQRGNRTDIARRVFCGHLLKIFEDATGKTATMTKNGPAHEFYSVCFSSFIQPMSDESTLGYLKDDIAHRNKIMVSPLFN
jgi:hypothetical protein